MFTVLVPARPGARPPLFGRRLRLERIRRGESAFAVLSIKNPARVRWDRVRACLGDSRERVVCGRGIEFPPDAGIARVEEGRFSACLARNGLAQLLEANRRTASDRAAVLIDLNCRHQAFADTLVGYFRTVRVVTRRENLYRNYADAKFYEGGAAVLISSALSEEEWEGAGRDCALYVTPDGLILPGMERTAAPIVSVGPLGAQLPQARMSIHSFRAELPEEYRTLLPAGVEEHPFGAALYEHCGQRGLAALQPVTAVWNGAEKSMNELKIPLFSLDIKSDVLYN